MGEALAQTDRAETKTRHANRLATSAVLLESLIERVQACERVSDLADVAGPGIDAYDIVFIDDLADVLASNRSVNEMCADTAAMALAARYSAMLKAALHILLQIRQLQGYRRP